MHTSELLRFYLFAQKSVNQSSLIEANPAGLTHHDTKPHNGDIPFLAVILAHVCFIIVCGIVVNIVSYVCKAVEDPPENATQDKDEIVSIKHFWEHPCKNCRFFNNNHYLNCAVHPTTAVTIQALNCSDYRLK
ncbi:MAG: hypothetical protein V7K92_28900 [Nostoc sp.]|uniref:hypothetical protein n=1 Tax=Nostoc sp. TaxID=1180 RepID=UPI002FF02DA3